MKNILKRITQLIIALVFIMGIAYLFLYQNNNEHVPIPTHAEFIQARDSAKRWIIANQDTALEDHNPMLWWMVKQSLLIESDTELENVYAAYAKRFQKDFPDSIWQKLFYPERYARLNIDEVLQYPDYNQHIIFGLTCDRELAEFDIIREQNTFEFCDSYHPISPACITHQMMGVYFAQKNNCLPVQTTTDLMTSLQNRVIIQLEYDPRLVDVYLQRVMMLLLSEKKELVKPVWIKRILDAQLKDGGWADFEGMVSTGKNSELGFTKKSLGISIPTSDFHATAQGLLIFTILATPPS
ncbi:MAG: hypothetical protein D6B28_07300 [Gammaproteobacteria bacterium]|mgnify:CR=1 FL=1|nr:MAG: hypothetical protein D6B28_07300 [Gammaproteobacteria bacterium]